MYILGIDIGSSSVKVALVEVETQKALAYAQSPQEEMPIQAFQPGWAEQDPNTWWFHLKEACAALKAREPRAYSQVAGAGITYQMHGLVLTDSDLNPLRPSIIWCDSRAVAIGDKAFKDLGPENCLARFLNSPGNFTASKLRWVMENEPSTYDRARYAMLPGDYIAARMTGEFRTTVSGLSEGILWDFIQEKPAHSLMTYFDFRPDLFPEAGSSFGYQGTVLDSVAAELGLPTGIRIGYRAGDQPNNAFALGVLEPGQVGANAGTSGVIYGINDQPNADPLSRVNSFAHVNHTAEKRRLGVLACLNGTGIFYSWVRKLVASGGTGDLPAYPVLNEMAATISPGSDGLRAYPFGNGAERFLANQDPGASFAGLNFNVHQPAHLVRATMEGIVFALHYGLEIMNGMGMNPRTVRAGEANLFLSPLFRQIFADTTGTQVELVDSNGSLGAAIGAAIGLGHLKESDWTGGLKPKVVISPDARRSAWYGELYARWKSHIPLN